VARCRRKIGAALKKKGKPFGQTLGHTVNDAPIPFIDVSQATRVPVPANQYD